MKINRFSVLSAALLLQMMTVTAMASEITGVTPVVNGNSNIYNITPQFINSNGGLGFRKYNKFDLSDGDVANFIMNNLSKFVNLVDSKVNINGLVNTVNSDMSKSNGGVVFVSPQGFVVGKSGVLNVGSLSVFTPSIDSYNALSGQLDSALAGQSSVVNFNPSSMGTGDGHININGKVVSNGDVTLNAKTVTIGADGYIVNGVNTHEVLDASDDDMFNTLVNTSSMSGESANINISTNGGDVELGGQVVTRNGNVNISAVNGSVVNLGTDVPQIVSSGNLTITATGNGGNVGSNPTGSNNLLQSVNVQVAGDVNIDAEHVVNIASIDKDLYVDTINAGDVVYLNVEDTKHQGVLPGLYSSKNRTSSGANVVSGGNIFIKSAGNIGSSSERFAVSSTSQSQQFNNESWNSNKSEYSPNGAGIEVVSNYGDIHIKSEDDSSNFKNLIAENGSVDAQFKGNTYIENLKAAQNVDVLTKGDVLYVKNLDNSKLSDSNGESSKVNLTALGLNSDINKSSNSTVFLKGGKVQNNAQVTLSADNVYADGVYVPLSADNEFDIPRFDRSTEKLAVVDEEGSNSASLTAKAVTRADVDKVEDSEGLARYYSENGLDNYDWTLDNEAETSKDVTSENQIATLDLEPEFGYDDDGGDNQGDDFANGDDDNNTFDPDAPDVGDDSNINVSDDEKPEPQPEFGDDDDGGDNQGDDFANGDDDNTIDPDVPPVGGDLDDDIDDDNDSVVGNTGTGNNEGGNEGDDFAGDDDNTIDPDVPPVGGDLDDDIDDDNDIPGGNTGGGNNEGGNEGDDFAGDDDNTIDPDVPPVGGDLDDDLDDDNDIPGGNTGGGNNDGGNEGDEFAGDDDNTIDPDVPPVGGDLDDDLDDDNDIPGGNTGGGNNEGGNEGDEFAGDDDNTIDPDVPPVGGDLDDDLDDDNDIPGGNTGGGNNEGGNEGDEFAGDDDNTIDPDVPPVGGDLDDDIDDDNDIPGGGGNNGGGNTGGGNTGGGNSGGGGFTGDGDIPGHPEFTITPDDENIQRELLEEFKNSTEPPKPMFMVPDVVTIEPIVEYKESSGPIVNSNGLFGDSYTEDIQRGEALKKENPQIKIRRRLK